MERLVCEYNSSRAGAEDLAKYIGIPLRSGSSCAMYDIELAFLSQDLPYPKCTTFPLSVLCLCVEDTPFSTFSSIDQLEHP